MDKNLNEQQGGIGRQFNRGPQQNEQQGTGSGRADISSMDQQEGLMNNGETGGSGTLAPGTDEEKSGTEQ